MINIDKKPTEKVKMKRIIEKKFLKKEVNSNTIIFESVNMKNSNARTFIIFYINDTTLFASILISKFLFEFENFLKIENKASMKAQTKEKNSKKSFKKTIEKQVNK